jgi:hypothetical protein
MVVYPSFSHRESAQDVDYIPRSFVSEYRALGFPDARQRLRTCIAEIARKFGLGTDWMSHPADLAFPRALEYATTLILLSPRLLPKWADDLILQFFSRPAAKSGARRAPTTRSSSPRRIAEAQFHRQTVFDECGLALIAVPLPWMLALKLACYTKHWLFHCAFLAAA